jgi:Antirestriction protein (ArdA)
MTAKTTISDDVLEDAERQGIPPEAFQAWVDNGDDPDDVLRCADAYQGEWESGADFAQSFALDLGIVEDGAKWPYSCIDWERAWRELSFDGYWTAPAGGGVYVFNANG